MVLLVSNCSVSLSPLLTLNNNHRLLRTCGLVRSVGGEINGASSVKRNKSFLPFYDDGGKKSAQKAPEKLEPLWDDGYGTQTMRDYAGIAMDLIKSDGGPPRNGWNWNRVHEKALGK